MECVWRGECVYIHACGCEWVKWLMCVFLCENVCIHVSCECV